MTKNCVLIDPHTTRRHLDRPFSGERRAILVVGMHRSGTSAITRTLNLLGAALPANLLAAREDNPTGFWESADLMGIHDRFLAAVGSAWDDPLPLPAAAFRTAAAAACHDEALAVLHRDFADAPVFAIKDPRICRLIPLWRDILTAFGARPCAVLPVRNPLETAMSLRLRNGIPREQALAQWIIHTAWAEQGTRDWPRCFVAYETFLADPAGQTLRLAQSLGCFCDERVAATLPDIQRFWSGELRHHRLTAPTPDDALLPRGVRRAYAWIAQASADQAADSTPIEALAQALAEAGEIYGPLVADAARLRRSVETQVRESTAGMAAQCERLAAENADLKHAAEESRRQAEDLSLRLGQQAIEFDAALAERRKVEADLGRANESLRADLAHTTEEQRAALAEQARLGSALIEAHGHLHTLRQTLEDTRQERARLAARLDTASGELTRARADLGASHADIERLEAERERLLTALATAEGRLDAAEDKQRRLQATLADTQAELAGVQAELADTQVHLAKTQAELAAAQAAHADGKKKLAANMAEGERLQAALIETGSAHAQTSAQLDTLGQTLAEDRQRSAHALAALAAILTEPIGIVSPGRRLGGLLRAAWRGRLRQRLREDAEIRVIARSGLFDTDYYLRRYPDVAAAHADPLVHYVRSGAAEGRDPNPLFDSRFYWSAYPDVARAGANALAHYIRFGAREGRRTHADARPGAPSLPGISPLLAARLGIDRVPAASPRPAPPVPKPAAPDTPAAAPALALPADAFTWLNETDRHTLADLLARYGLADRDNAPPDWDAEAAAQRVAQALGGLPQGPAGLSIVIPVHNQLRHTLACLESLALWPAGQPIEILIGDDASTDESVRLLPTLPKVTYLRSERAEGFVDNCNRTAAHAQGRHLLFLNNDTVILPGALDALLDTFERHPDCGLAGGRLLYPDGRQQEAGGIVWADGSGWNYGRGDRPEKPEYSYLREADYCSGAAIAVPAKVWRELGGFDPRYRPAYYEDTDLAFRVRKAGLRVLYQPDAHVIHCEGVSNGTSEAAGLKRHQRENRPVFAARWQAALASHGLAEGKPAHFAERSRRGRVLVLDTTPPTPDRDSGSQDTLILLKLLRRQGWHVTFLPENLLDHAPYTAALRQEGIECVHYPLVDDFMAAAAHLAAQSDAVVVSRQPLARRVMGLLKSAAPRAKLVFNTIDLHFLREEREAGLFGDADAAARAAETRTAELASIRAADATLVVSAYEADMLTRLAPAARVCVMPVRREVPAGPFADFDRRDGVLFIGGFRHPPNQDAVRWLLAEIWPRVRAAGLRAPLYIAGADAPPFLQDDPANGVCVLGHVPQLADAFAGVRLSVAPIRYGAGLKGKVIDSLLHSVPTVATPIATEGAGLAHQKHLLEAQAADDFAAAIVRLHEDAALWRQLATNGLAAGRALFSADHADRALRQLWADLGFAWCLPEPTRSPNSAPHAV